MYKGYCPVQQSEPAFNLYRVKLKQIEGLEHRLTKCQQACSCSVEVTSARTILLQQRLVWFGLDEAASNKPFSRKDQGREILKKQGKRWSDHMHVIGSQQCTASCSRSYRNAVTRLSSLHCSGVSGFWTVMYSTCLSAEPGSSLFCSHFCTWMGNPLTSNHDQQIPNPTGQQNQSKKKNSVFLLLLIFGQLACHHHLSMPPFLTDWNKSFVWQTREIFWNLLSILL